EAQPIAGTLASKARPRRDAAKDETARAVARRVVTTIPPNGRTCTSGRTRAALSCRGGPGGRISGVKILPEAPGDPPPTQYLEFGLAGLPAARSQSAREVVGSRHGPRRARQQACGTNRQRSWLHDRSGECGPGPASDRA